MQAVIDKIIAGPISDDAPFILNGRKVQQIHDQALKIRGALGRYGNAGKPVCLCTQDRGQVAAALLAAICGAGPLILPYAFSKQALTETKEALAFDFALVDKTKWLPDGVTGLDMQRLPEPDTLPEQKPLRPEDVWVYLFTGGSTGKPKTWSKTTNNLLSEACYLADAFNVTSEDTILATVPPHHIYGLLYSVLVPLVCGAQVAAQAPAFPNEIILAVEKTRATVLVSIPPHYRVLKNQPLPNHCLTTAFSSAGALAPEDDLAFYETTGVTISEVYGSTETGGIALRCRSRGQTNLKPFECVDWKIDGERLWVKSHFLSPELKKNEEGFFQTADRAALQEGQSFTLLGRCDGIVKVAGKRVDLSAIQQTLKQRPGVRDAYVFSRPVGKGRENQILALVESDADAEKLRIALQEQLEPYAQPRLIKVVNKLPLSKVGKYDRSEIEKLFT